MEAGRAMDSLIAEQVMGWKVFVGEPGYGRPPDKPISLVLDTIPHYSTDIAAAWLIVEKLRGDFELDLADHILFWTARFTKTGASMHLVIDAPTAPHAICLAALHAMGV